MSDFFKAGGNFKNSLQSAADRAKYDQACKCILKERSILACILKGTVSEYRECSLEEIANKYIEPESICSDIPVARNMTNIRGISEEDATINEGTVKYDIKFIAKSPSIDGKSLVTLFIDVEAQKKYSNGYAIEKRAEYYCARMLSSQAGDITESMDYSVLNKVYSIWICFDVPQYAANTISRYYFFKEDLYGCFDHIDESDYNLMEAVIIRLSQQDTEVGNSLIDLLHGIFSSMSLDEKMARLNKLGLDVESIKEEMGHMCNLSERILEQGMERGMERGIERGIEQGIEKARYEMVLKMYQKGISLEQISDFTDIEVWQIRKWVGKDK